MKDVPIAQLSAKHRRQQDPDGRQHMVSVEHDVRAVKGNPRQGSAPSVPLTALPSHSGLGWLLLAAILCPAATSAAENLHQLFYATRFSGHALDQMQNRGIMPSVVDNTIMTGTTFPTKPGTVRHFDPVNKIRVITNAENGTVVTVIRGAP